MLDAEESDYYHNNYRMMTGEEFILSSAQSNVETVRKLSSCGAGGKDGPDVDV